MVNMRTRQEEEEEEAKHIRLTIKHNYFNDSEYEEISSRFSILKARAESHQLNKIDYLRYKTLTNSNIRPQIEMYLASFSPNNLDHTPETIKKRLLTFFPEMCSFFRRLDELYPSPSALRGYGGQGGKE